MHHLGNSSFGIASPTVTRVVQRPNTRSSINRISASALESAIYPEGIQRGACGNPVHIVSPPRGRCRNPFHQSRNYFPSKLSFIA
jgi:hypothetical protein